MLAGRNAIHQQIVDSWLVHALKRHVGPVNPCGLHSGVHGSQQSQRTSRRQLGQHNPGREPGTPKQERTSDATPWDGAGAMALLLGGLLVFSVWLPAPVLQLIRGAAGIVGGKP